MRLINVTTIYVAFSSLN